MDDIRVDASDIQMACEWHANGIKNFKPFKGFGAFRFVILKIICGKNVVLGGCKWFFATRLFQFPYCLLEFSKFNYRTWEPE